MELCVHLLSVMPEGAEQVPFSERLVPSEHSETGSQPLYELEKDGRHIVRFFRFRNERHEVLHRGDEISEEQKTWPEHGQRLFQELERHYGIHVVPFHYVIGENVDHELGVYTVANKLEGKNLQDELQQEHPTVSSEKVEMILIQLCTYLENKHVNDEPMLRDIFDGGQFVYDKLQQEIVLVDVEPLIASSTSPANRWGTRLVIKNLWYLSDLVRSAEEVFGSPLVAARTAIRDFALRLTPHQGEQERYSEILRNIGNG